MLKELAGVLMDTVADRGFVGRICGEEFAIFLAADRAVAWRTPW